VKAVLIVIVMMTNNADIPPFVTAIEFNDHQACIRGASSLEETMTKLHPNVMVTTRCLDKGSR
jgi:hypothetical protein